MNNCGTCRHWDYNWSENGVADCGYVDEVEKGDKTFKLDFYVHDDSGLTMSLKTGENFGCIHYTPKEIKQ